MSRTGLAAKYQQIALDIAQRIVNREFAVGQKLYGRSVLASMYNVSPETIRKSVALLQEMDVLKVSHGSGTTVNSIERAYNFIQRFKYLDSVSSLKNDLEKLLLEKHEIDRKLEKTLHSIIEYSDKLKHLSPYNPIEVEVEGSSQYIGSTISDLKFWQNTGGTVVAIRKKGQLIVSPGPYAVIDKGDVIVVVGGNDILKDVEKFINNKDIY